MLKSPLLRQIIKFCVVGGTSFVIDTGLTFLFVRGVSFNGKLMSTSLGDWLLSVLPSVFGFAHSSSDAAVPILTGAAAAVAILNSFIWNRMWTFGIRGKGDALLQLRRFYLISIVGYVLNVLITTVMNNIIAGHPNKSLFLAKVAAAAVVAVWNYCGQRFYAFRVAEE